MVLGFILALNEYNVEKKSPCHFKEKGDNIDL